MGATRLPVGDCLLMLGLIGYDHLRAGHARRTFAKELIHAVLMAASMMWESLLEEDSRFRASACLGMLKRRRKHDRVPIAAKWALAQEFLNWSGNGVNSVHQLCVGIALGQADDQTAKTSMYGGLAGNLACSQKKRKVHGAVSKSTANECSGLYLHNYFQHMRITRLPR